MAISDNNQRIVKNSVFMSIRMVFVLFISLYTSRIVLGVLGVVDYGIHNVVAGFVTMFTFMSSALSTGIQRFYNYELGRTGSDGANIVYNTALLIQCGFALILVILIEIIGLWFLHHKMVIPADRISAATCVFHLSVVTLVINIVQVPYMAAVIAHECMGFYAIMSVINAAITLIGVYFVKIIGYDSLTMYGMILTIIALISLIAYIIYSKLHFDEIFISHRVNRKLFKEMLSFSGWNIFGTFGHMLKDQGANIILNILFGPVVNAARGISVQVNSGLNGLVSNVTIPVRPQMIQAYSQGDKNRSYNLTFAISKLSCIVLAFVAIPIILEIEYVLEIWLGDNVPTYTKTFTTIIILDSFLLNLNSAISGLVHASGKMKVYQLTGGLVSVMTIICAYLSVLIFKNPSMVFYMTLIFDIIRQIVAIYVVKQIEREDFSISKYIRIVVIPLLIVLVLGFIPPFILHIIMSQGLIRLITVIIISILSIMLTAYIFALNTSEKQMVKQIFKKLIKK